MELETFRNRGEWLKKRNLIGGSDAAAVLGLSPYKSNVDLWEEKTGRRTPPDIGGNPYVQYGTKAEPFLRELFKLDFPEYEVSYSENNMVHNSAYPFAHASLDGWLRDKSGRLGILEIKTAEISSATQKMKWDERVPDHYFCQILHYMMITGAQFAVLKAHLGFEVREERRATERHYFLERSEFLNDIEYLCNEERRFWEYVQRDERPPLMLAGI